MIKQFCVYRYDKQPVLVMTNMVFNDVQSILVAPVKPRRNVKLISDLQVPCKVQNENCFVDLLDIATVSRRRLNHFIADLQNHREEIKQGLDILIDGF